MGPPNDTRPPALLAGGRGEGWAVGRDPECLTPLCFARVLFPLCDAAFQPLRTAVLSRVLCRSARLLAFKGSHHF